MDAESLLMDDLCEDQGLPQDEGPIYGVKSAGLCTEDEEYITKIKEFQASLDLVYFKPGFSCLFSLYLTLSLVGLVCCSWLLLPIFSSYYYQSNT